MVRLPIHLLRQSQRVVLTGCLLASALVSWPGKSYGQSRPSFPLTGSNPRRTACVEVCEKSKFSVVNIHSEKTIASSQRGSDLQTASQRVNGMGTGIVLDPRGYVITNHHVVDDVQLLRVKLADGSSLPATLIARDPESDLAILKIEPIRPLTTVPLGTADDLMDGEPVIAVGNAFGYEHTVTTGVVSAQKRNVTLNKDVSYRNLIQTDASINPGNSGGPLLNIHGELIGVNVAIRAGAQGIGFAITVDQMIGVATELMSIKRRMGFTHGLTVRNRVDTRDNPVRRWAMVERVDTRFVSSEAGIQVGDIIDTLNDQPVKTSLDIERILLEARPNERLTVKYRRGVNAYGEGGTVGTAEWSLKAITSVASYTGNPQGDLVYRKVGLRMQPVGADVVNRVNPQLRGGMLITELAPNTPAAKAGVQRGDILIGMHTWETISLDNVHFVITHPEAINLAPLKFYVLRNGRLETSLLAWE